MTFAAGKASNFTGIFQGFITGNPFEIAGETITPAERKDVVDFNALDNHLRAVDRDLQNLFLQSSPSVQFGSGNEFDYLRNTGSNTWAWSGTIGGWTISGVQLAAGSGVTFIGLKPGTGIWLGDDAFGDADFSVDPAGVLKAHSGDVGGWSLAATTLTSANITIDSGNELLKSNDFVSGALGTGWQIGTNLAEFQNIRARGKFTSATFEKDVISAVGGNLLIADSDILDADMTALDASTLTISGDTTFAVGDFLRIKDGVSDEWLEVTNIASAPTYTVTRDKASAHGADSNPIWKKGTAVVNYQASGDGVIFMTASDANAPHINVITHAGAPWTTTTTEMRIGNLNGYLGETSDRYGIGIGTTTNHIKFDSTNGLIITLSTANAITVKSGSDIKIESGGDLNIESGGDINIAGGGDIVFTGADSNPGKLIWDGTNDVEFSANASGGTLSLFSTADSDLRFQIGSTTKRLDQMEVFIGGGAGNDQIFLKYHEDANKSRHVRVDIDDARIGAIDDGASAACSVSCNDSGSISIFASGTTVLTGVMHPPTNKADDLGLAATAFDDVWADDFQNVADFYQFDNRDDLAALHSIKPSGIIDPVTGYELIDDDTLPNWLLKRAKRDKVIRVGGEIKYQHSKGQILRDPDGRPYLSLKTMISLCMGAIRQLDNKVEAL